MQLTEQNFSQEEGPTYPSPVSASYLSFSCILVRMDGKRKLGPPVIKRKKAKGEKNTHGDREETLMRS